MKLNILEYIQSKSSAKEFITEQFLMYAKNYEYKDYPIHKNPTISEIKEILEQAVEVVGKTDNTVRAFVWKNDLYAFHPDFHESVIDHVGANKNDCLPLFLGFTDSFKLITINLANSYYSTRYGYQGKQPDGWKDKIKKIIVDCNCLKNMITPSTRFTYEGY